jgi:hypothetical protein
VASPTWSAISGILGGSTVAQQYITALAIAPSDPKTVYAATSDGHVSATANGGTSWPKRDTGLFGSGAGQIVDIRIDPTNPKRAVAVGSGQQSVWYLDKVGASLQWTNIAGNLPTYLRFVTIFADWQFATPALYVGTTRGIYHSVDLGLTWSTFGLDMPNTVVSDLQSVLDNVLFASTNGRGAWAIVTKPTFILGTMSSDGILQGYVGPADPVEGAVITLDPGSGLRGAVLTAVTDAEGRFELPLVPPGTYTVHRSVPPGWVPAGDEVDRISVHGERLELEFRYRFDPELARSLAPYQAISDLVAVPGREPTAPLGAVGEFEKPQSATRRGNGREK